MITEKAKKLFQNKTFRAILVCVLALLLLLAVWWVFFRESADEETGYKPNALEERLGRLLSEIEGVEEATVMIGEEDGAAVSAVVVIRGNLGLVTRMRVLDAAANALHIPRQDILVYPADQ